MSAHLTHLAEQLAGSVLHGGDALLDDAVHDSATVRPGALFCAVRGQRHDGHDHAARAVADGAAALLVEQRLELDVPQLVVASVRAAMGPAAAFIHGEPARALRMLVASSAGDPAGAAQQCGGASHGVCVCARALGADCRHRPRHHIGVPVAVEVAHTDCAHAETAHVSFARRPAR